MSEAAGISRPPSSGSEFAVQEKPSANRNHTGGRPVQPSSQLSGSPSCYTKRLAYNGSEAGVGCLTCRLLLICASGAPQRAIAALLWYPVVVSSTVMPFSRERPLTAAECFSWKKGSGRRLAVILPDMLQHEVLRHLGSNWILGTRDSDSPVAVWAFNSRTHFTSLLGVS